MDKINDNRNKKGFFSKIGGFFKNAWNKGKKIAGKIFNGAHKVWGKISPVVKPLIGLIPGVGPAISAGLDTADNIYDKLKGRRITNLPKAGPLIGNLVPNVSVG